MGGTLTDPRDTAALDALCDEYGITLRTEQLRAPLYELLLVVMLARPMVTLLLVLSTLDAPERI